MPNRNLLSNAQAVVSVGRDGMFTGIFVDRKQQTKEFTCLFGGTDMLMSASSGYTPFGDQPDGDGDGVPDYVDNCTDAKNADQLDSDGDGYGNACDGDLNNDGRTDSLDLGLFKKAFTSTSGDDPDLRAATDFNGDGKIDSLDLGLFKKLFSKSPGPSALRCRNGT